MRAQHDLRSPGGQPSRRTVFRGAAGAGAVGVAAAAWSGLGGRAWNGRTRTPGTGTGRPAADDAAEQIVVHVRDAAAGHIDVYRGSELVRLHDPELAGRLARISRA